MKKVGLVLEGGGMRGVFTSGVLDAFLENEISIPYVIGVSAGACNAMNYVSGQFERSRIVNIDALKKYDYIRYSNLFTKGSIFDMELLFNDFPRKLYPYDFESFHRSEKECLVVTTNCETGEPVYFGKTEDDQKLMTILKASCSLPFVSPIVGVEGIPMLDGGIGDSIPLKKAIRDGCEHNIVVLTRPFGYRKDVTKDTLGYKLFYKKYPKLQEALQSRNHQYNGTMELIEALERKNQILVIRPQDDFSIDRLEKNTEKLTSLFDHGYTYTQTRCDEIKGWLKDKI